MTTFASAQQRPLVTEDPETVGAGNVLVEGGFDWQQDVGFPATGLRGDLLRIATAGVSFGLSSILELQVDGVVYNRLNVTSSVPAPLSPLVVLGEEQRTAGIGDLVIGTKIRLVSEAAGRPSVGIRLATKLPTASIEDGFALDTTDFTMSALVGKTVQSVRVVGNFGLGIWSNPIADGDSNHRVVVYGVSFARALQQGLEFVGEINGHVNPNEDVEVLGLVAPTGLESRSGLRAGLRFTRGTVRVDGGLLFGLTSRDPNFGFTGGVTYVFRGFKLP